MFAEGAADKVNWAPSSSGRFSCKSFMLLLSMEGQVSNRWKGLWELPIPLKVKYFVWLVLRNRIAIRSKL